MGDCQCTLCLFGGGLIDLWVSGIFSWPIVIRVDVLLGRGVFRGRVCCESCVSLIPTFMIDVGSLAIKYSWDKPDELSPMHSIHLLQLTEGGFDLHMLVTHCLCLGGAFGGSSTWVSLYLFTACSSLSTPVIPILKVVSLSYLYFVYQGGFFQ